MGHLVEVCRRRGPKLNAGNSKVVLLGGEKDVECKVCEEGM